MKWKPTEIFNLEDPTGQQHSNTKTTTFLVIVAVIVLLFLTLPRDIHLTAWDAMTLISLVIATASIRALLAFWKIRANGGFNGLAGTKRPTSNGNPPAPPNVVS